MPKKVTWLPIPGFEHGYEVSDTGYVRSITRELKYSNGRDRVRRGKLLTNKKFVTPYGTTYHRVQLWLHCKAYMPGVHTLVAKAFLGDKSYDHEVNHKNGVPTDNRIENLEWMTQKENSIHASQTNPRKIYKIEKTIQMDLN